MSDVDEKLRKDVKELQVWLRGNGERGVFGRLDDLERGHENVNNIATRTERSLEAFMRERREEQAEFRGFKKAIYLISAVFALGGGGVATWVVAALNKVLSSP